MRILYLTQWFDPEPGVIKGPAFVRGIQAAGHEVTVVTGFPNYPTGRIYEGYRLAPVHREVVDGVNVVRIPLYPSHSQSSVGRALNFLSFFLSAFFYGLFRAGRYDFIYVYHPPITVGLAAALFGMIRRRRFSIEIQDLWPDMLAASGMAGTGRLARILGPVCNFVYARASAVIVQSEGMRSRLIERGVSPEKLIAIRNPADPTALERPEPMSREQLGLGSEFSIIYGGNLGAAQALSSAVDAAKLATENGATFNLRLMGRGIEAEMLKKRAEQIGADNISFREPVAKGDVSAVFQAADALLIQWADKPLFQITIPSKTQFCLASGKPILAAVAGETAEILSASGAAIVVPPGDVDAMARAITALSQMNEEDLKDMGQRGAEYYTKVFSFDKMVADTVAVIEKAAR